MNISWAEIISHPLTSLLSWHMDIINNYILEIKESLLVKRDRPVLNKKISSAKLFLFDNFETFLLYLNTLLLLLLLLILLLLLLLLLLFDMLVKVIGIKFLKQK